MPYIQIDGLQLAYQDEGQGPAILLLHGFPLDSTMWRHQIIFLSATYRVIAPDLRGMGRSAVTGAAAPFPLSRYAEDSLKLLDELGIAQAAVAGFSMGGYAAMSLLRLAPERVNALVLANTRPDADAPQGRSGRFKMAADLTEHGASAAADAMLPKLLSPATLAAQPELADSLRAGIGAMDPAGLVHACLAMAFRPDSTSLLTTIGKPVLVIGGEHDPITTPGITRGMAEAIPGAQYFLIPDTSHLTPMEQPEKFNDALASFFTAHL